MGTEFRAPEPGLRRPPPKLSARHADAEPPPLVQRIAAGLRYLSGSVDRARLMRAGLFALAGLLLAVGGGLVDGTVHRGVESGIVAPIVRQTTGRDLAANVDLTRLTPDQLPLVAEMLQANGIRLVRQPFAWAEIEPAPGGFTWDRYDAIMEELGRRGIGVVGVMQRSPGWVRASDAAEAFDAPPVDPAAYERFVNAVATRYGDRLSAVQLWDLPNRSDHWGGKPPDPAAYVTLIGYGSNGVRGANPDVPVLLAELDPRPETGMRDRDLAYLDQVYRAGGAPYFDVVAARVDGGRDTPFDRAVDADGTNLSRAVLFREVMERAGDGAKPVWATHYGWQAEGPEQRGVSPSDQAEYTVAGIERARTEWPWMGPMFLWGLTPGPDLQGTVPVGRTLLGADGVPSAMLSALGEFHASGMAEIAATGALPVTARQFRTDGEWDVQQLGKEIYLTTKDPDASAQVIFRGTGIEGTVRLSRQAAPVEMRLDGEVIPLDLGAFRAADSDVVIGTGLPDGLHELEIRLAGPGEFTIGGVMVERSVPLEWPVMLLVGSGVGLLFLGMRTLYFTLAERSGRLERGRHLDLWLDLPPIPDWRSSSGN